MARSRLKGKGAELEVVRLVRDLWPRASRNLDQTRAGGSGRDLNGTEPWVVQVKRRARMRSGVVETGLTEAMRELDGNRWRFAAVVHRSDREPWQVTVPLRHLVEAAGGRGPLPLTTVTLPLVSFLALLLLEEVHG